MHGQPGPFRLGADGIIEKAFTDAGFKNVQSALVESPLLFTSAKECLRFEKESFGVLHQMMSSLLEAEKASIWEEIESELQKFETADGFRSPCEMVVGEK